MARAKKQLTDRELLIKNIGGLSAAIQCAERQGMEAGPYNALLAERAKAQRALVRYDMSVPVRTQDLATGEWIERGGYDTDDYAMLEQLRERYAR